MPQNHPERAMEHPQSTHTKQQHETEIPDAAAAAAAAANEHTRTQPPPQPQSSAHGQPPIGLDTPPSQTHRIEHSSSTSSASTQMSSPNTGTTRSLSSTVPPSPDLMSLHFHIAQPLQQQQQPQAQPPPPSQSQVRSPEKKQIQSMGPMAPLLASPALAFMSVPPRQQQHVTYSPGPPSVAALAAASAQHRPRSLPSSPGHPSIHVDASKLLSSRVYVGNVTFNTKADELQQFFYEALGVTSEVQIITYPGGKSKGCAIVEFPSIADAVRAINDVQNKQLHGRTIFIREDREEKGFGGPNGVTGGGGAAGGGAASPGFHDHLLQQQRQCRQHPHPSQNMWNAAARFPLPSAAAGAAAAQYHSPSPPPLTMQQQPPQQLDMYAAAVAAFQQQQQQQQAQAHQTFMLQQQMLDQAVQHQQAMLAEQQVLDQRRRVEQAYASIQLMQNPREQQQIMAFLAAAQSQAAATAAAAAAGYATPLPSVPASPYAASSTPSPFSFSYSPAVSPSPSLSQSMEHLRLTASQQSSRSTSFSNSHYHANAAAAASAAAAAGFPSYPNAQSNLFLQPMPNGQAAGGAGAGAGAPMPMQMQMGPRVRSRGGAQNSCSQLYFTNLPYSLSHSGLVSLCAAQGPLAFVRLITDDKGHSRGCANVKYVHRADAIRAINNLQSRLLDSRYINVRMDDGTVQMPQLQHQG